MYVQPLLQWKNNKYYICWVCVCSLSYPACNVQARYCHLRAVQLYNILPHYLTNGIIFKNKLLNKQYVSIYSKTAVLNISHSKKQKSEIWSKMYIRLHVKYCRYSCQTLMKLEFSRQTFKKTLKYQTSWKSVQCEASCSTQMDGQIWRS
jgi:hypothetical protein